MIVVIDYGAGNLRSVANALQAIGSNAVITTDPSDVRSADGIVLPGVGAFAVGMERLREGKFLPALTDAVITERKPYLGICLGLQFLAEKGEEHEESEGLGWIKGAVRKIEPNDPDFKVPHMGWNTIDIKRESELFVGLQEDPAFYFVHSYALEVAPEEGDVITSTCNHGCVITASVQKGNIFATQFHPEKSQNAGLMVLKNFVSYCMRS